MIKMRFLADENFYVKCDFEHRNIPKDAGFLWHTQHNLWYTSDAFVANRLAQYGDEAARKAIDSHLNRFKNSSATDSDFEPPVKAGVELFPYQKAGVEWCIDKKFTVLGDEPGLGKTSQCIVTWNVTQPKRTLILCPSSLKLNWQQEFNMWAVRPHNLFVAHGTKFRIPPDAEIVVCNYDLVTYDWPVAELNRFKADFVVLDESHYLKNYKAKRTKNVLGRFIKDMKGLKGVARYADRVIAVSGTPIVNRPIEFWPILSAFAKQAIAPYDDFLKFGKRYCSAYRDGFGWVMTGSSNEEELNRKLRSTVMIRRLKSEVLKQLPEKQWQLIELEGDKEIELLVHKEHLLVQASQIKELSGVIPRLDAEDLEGIDQSRPIIAQLAEMRQEVALAKMPICIEHIENLLQSVDKLVVFAVHRSVIKRLQMDLAKYNPVVVDGSVSQAVRNKNVNVFQSDPHCRVFIGNIQAAGVGLTLTAASNVVFVEITWVPGELDQAIDRCHRIGQKNNVLAQFLMLKDSVDQMLIRKIIDKQKVIQKILK